MPPLSYRMSTGDGDVHSVKTLPASPIHESLRHALRMQPIARKISSGMISERDCEPHGGVHAQVPPQTCRNTRSQCPQSRNGDLPHIAHLATEWHFELSGHENSHSVVLNFRSTIPFRLLVAIRLILHSGNLRYAVGIWIGAGVQCHVTTLILYAVRSSHPLDHLMPVVGLRAFSWRSSPGPCRFRFPSTSLNLGVRLSNHDVDQVTPLFLVTLLVANQSALTGETIASRNLRSAHLRTQDG